MLLVSLPDNVGKGAGAETLRKVNSVPKSWDLGRLKPVTESVDCYRIFEMEALSMTLCELCPPWCVFIAFFLIS